MESPQGTLSDHLRRGHTTCRRCVDRRTGRPCRRASDDEVPRSGEPRPNWHNLGAASRSLQDCSDQRSWFVGLGLEPTQRSIDRYLKNITNRPSFARKRSALPPLPATLTRRMAAISTAHRLAGRHLDNPPSGYPARRGRASGACCAPAPSEPWRTPAARASLIDLAALWTWLEAADITGGAVFRAINRHGRIATHLSDRAIALIVKRRAAAAGTDPANFSAPHCAPGCAAEAAAHGSRNAISAAITRHRSVPVLRGSARGRSS